MEKAVSKSTVGEEKVKHRLLVRDLLRPNVRLSAGGNCYRSTTEFNRIRLIRGADSILEPRTPSRHSGAKPALTLFLGSPSAIQHTYKLR